MQEIEYHGAIRIGHQVKIGYYAQNQAERLKENLTVLETVDNVATGDVRTRVRDLLGAFMFSGEEVDKKVSVLSGGERTRLAMVLLLLEPVNFLILDEPTNHLDMRSKDILKQALNDFEGTVLVVSHDREFLDGLVTRIFEFSDRKIKEHIGGIYEFLEKKRMDNLQELEKQPSRIKANKNLSGSAMTRENKSGKAAFAERKELNKSIKKAENEVNALEKAITQIEAEMDRVLAKMNRDSENAIDTSLFEEFVELQDKMEKKMNQWESAHAELEQLEKKRSEMDA
jgi:ATP-binding cassette subfamily F protein 3